MNFPQALDLSGVGTGGAGTYSTDFANLVLGNDIDNLLASQLLAEHQVHITTSDLNRARGNFATLIDGAIAAQSQQASAVGGTGGCLKADGSPYTGKTLLAALSTGVRNTELVNQAVEESLLARGADLSDAAVLAYYAANPTQFVKDCVSAIQTTGSRRPTAAYDKLEVGHPVRPGGCGRGRGSGGGRPGAAPCGCFSEATVLSQLQVPSVAEGQPVGPVQSNGTWLVYVVTSRTTDSGRPRRRRRSARCSCGRRPTGSGSRARCSPSPGARRWTSIRSTGRGPVPRSPRRPHPPSATCSRCTARTSTVPSSTTTPSTLPPGERLVDDLDHDLDHRLDRGLSRPCPTPRASTWSGSGRPAPS